jgi:hypothetical protein
MTIKQSVINSFNRVGIPYQDILAYKRNELEVVKNRFSGESTTTTALVAECINWVYKTSEAYERGDYSVKVADFDRIRYFVLAEDSEAYMTCLD